MAPPAGTPSRRPARDETPAERYDRNFSELLQELRVVQTGTQVLFAFLLSIAFTQVFQRQDQQLHAVYVVTLLLTVLATGLLVAPAAYHRQHFRRAASRRRSWRSAIGSPGPAC